MKKLLKASAISGAEFIVSLSVLISVILRFVQDLRELSSFISFQVLDEFFLFNSKLCFSKLQGLLYHFLENFRMQFNVLRKREFF